MSDLLTVGSKFTRSACRAAAAAIDLYVLRSRARPQQQTRRAPLLLSIDGTDRQTDGHSTVYDAHCMLCGLHVKTGSPRRTGAGEKSAESVPGKGEILRWGGFFGKGGFCAGSGRANELRTMRVVNRWGRGASVLHSRRLVNFKTHSAVLRSISDRTTARRGRAGCAEVHGCVYSGPVMISDPVCRG